MLIVAPSNNHLARSPAPTLNHFPRWRGQICQVSQKREKWLVKFGGGRPKEQPRSPNPQKKEQSQFKFGGGQL